MTEGIDYIVVQNANTINYGGALLDQIKCVFIGTKNYFFAIPYAITNFTPGYRKDTVEKTDFYYAGMPLQEYLIELLKDPQMSVDAFEQHILDHDFDDIKIINLETDCAHIKAKTGFLSSGLMYNKDTGKRGWKLFLANYKKRKHAVKEFYQNHPKFTL